MSRYQILFSELKEKHEGAFVPFVMLGDPGIDASFAIIETLIAAGADALELGIPFSDPVADGPVIQAAANRALAAGVTPLQCFALLRRVREKYPEIAIGLLVYCNLVAHHDPLAFYRELGGIGVDSVLIADLSTVEVEPFAAAAKAAGIAPVLVVPPNASADVIARVARIGAGYTYLLGRSGVTGTETVMQIPADVVITALQQANAAPALIGFGISTPAHVRAAIDAGAAGAIAGSAIVKIIETHRDDSEALHRHLAEFVAAMKAATRS